jgi:alpha-beta hydrolase superfamily lysophospholipase
MKQAKWSCCCFLLVSPSVVLAQTPKSQPGALGDLPRHGVIGLTLKPADVSKSEDPESNPPTVADMATGGAAQAAGIQRGDVVKELDSERIASSVNFAYRIGRHFAGDTVSLVLMRGGQRIEKAVRLKPRPLETSADAEVLYDSVAAEGARRRTIVTHPKAPGRHPAVLIVGGLGCYSLDGALSAKDGYGPILSTLAEKGFVTMRVEKTGEGDSEGPACTDLKATAEREAQGYVAGLQALRSYEFVDSEKIFVFAHSLGPLIVSLALPDQKIRGVVATETVGRSWFEYGLENVRRQSALIGESLDQVDADVREHAKCAYHFYVDHETAEEVAKLGAQCRDMLSSYAGMPYTYMQQVGDISLGKQWKQIDAPVLVVYGTSDPATSADEGHYLAGLINRFRPGKATYAEIAGMGHDFARYESQAEFLNRRNSPKAHPFDEELLTVVLNWLEQRLQG